MTTHYNAFDVTETQINNAKDITPLCAIFNEYQLFQGHERFSDELSRVPRFYFGKKLLNFSVFKTYVYY